MKKLLLMIMCLSMLCMLFSITAFAAESEQENLVPEGAEVIQNGQILESGKTYYVVWVPYGAYSGGGIQLISAVSSSPSLYYSFYLKVNAIGKSDYKNITSWYGAHEGSNSPYILTANSGCEWDQSCFVFPDVSANQLEYGKYYTVQFTVPDDSKTYYLRTDVADLSQYSAQVYTYTPCEHIYDNACDSNCNKCNYYRSVEHAYSDDNDHFCIVCYYQNPTPTHMYVANGNHNCSVCGIENSQPTHIYDDDNDLTCNYCSYEREKPNYMEALLNNFVLSSAGIFGIASIFTTWAIADELVAFGLVLSIISFMAYLVIKSKNGY